MGVYAKATPLRMLGVAVLVTATLVLFGGGTAKAKDLDGDYTLTNDITEQIRIVENKNVVLNLNGYDITTTGEDAIVVEKGATLTVVGGGTVEAIGSGSPASLYNKGGEVVLNGGIFYKDVSKNGYYAILNHGEMTINAGVTVKMVGDPTSSLMANGYYSFTNTSNDKQGYIAGLNYEKPTMIINGGIFDGGLNTVKNDDNGVLEINDGTFSNTTQVAVMNWNEAVINGGTFTVANGAALSNGGYGLESVDRGLFVINGGIYNAEALFNENAYDENTGFTYDPVEVNGGEFNVQSVMVPGLEPIALPCITGGLFTDDSIELPALPAGYYRYTVKGGATLVTDEAVDFKGGDFVVNLTVGDSYLLDLPQLVLDNATISLENLDGVIDRLGNEVFTVHPGVSLVKVEFNNQVQTYVINIADVVDDNQDDTDAPSVTDPVEKAPVDEADIVAPNTGITTLASDSIGGTSALATITTALAMLVVLAGIRIAAKEND